MQATSVSATMALPALLGYWLDGKLGTKGVFSVIGVILGFAFGLWQWLRLAADEPKERVRPKPPDTKPEQHNRGDGQYPCNPG